MSSKTCAALEVGGEAAVTSVPAALRTCSALEVGGEAAVMSMAAALRACRGCHPCSCACTMQVVRGEAAVTSMQAAADARAAQAELAAVRARAGSECAQAAADAAAARAELHALQMRAASDSVAALQENVANQARMQQLGEELDAAHRDAQQLAAELDATKEARAVLEQRVLVLEEGAGAAAPAQARMATLEAELQRALAKADSRQFATGSLSPVYECKHTHVLPLKLS
eukprot:1152652-Pelagomonas_calceolata.AAC.2